MDLGIKGRTALVCGASKGLGRACADALAAEGVNLVLTARGVDALERTASELRATHGVDVVTAPGDIATADGRRIALELCPAPDILVNNAGGPPVGNWRDFEREQWLAAVDNNMVAAIMLIRAVVDGMAQRKFGRIVNITSALVKQPHPSLGLSVAARIGLTAFSKSIAAECAASNITINNLLPEGFATDRLRSNIGNLTEQSGRTLDEEMGAAADAIPAKRMGRSDEFGAICAFYCSAHAGYLTGQNVMLDGGRYPAVF